METDSAAGCGVSYPPLRGIVQLTNSDPFRFRNWSFTNKYAVNLFSGKISFRRSIFKKYSKNDESMKNIRKKLFILFIISLFILSCASRTTHVRSVEPTWKRKPLEMMGYTIQAGAFAKVENAVRLTETLKARGLDSTYFKAADGLFKVRFGNYPTKEMARQRAQVL